MSRMPMTMPKGRTLPNEVNADSAHISAAGVPQS